MMISLRSSCARGLSSGLRVCVSILLILSLGTPIWAVVFSNTDPIVISDAAAIGTANPYPSDIVISGTTGTVTNVTVTLNTFNHTFPDDVDIMLVAPGGNNLVLMSDAGGGADVFGPSLTFDDAAAAAIADGGPISGGTFKPSQYVTGDVFPAPAPVPSANTTFAAAFNGIAADGTWSLYAVDDLGLDMGTLGNGWTITITTTGGIVTSSNPGVVFLNERWGRAGVYPSPITVSGLTGAIADVNVTLTNANHLNPDDLDIMLVSPAGKRLIIMSDAGGTTDLVGVNITIDDAAATVLPDTTVIATGSFRPANYGGSETFHDLLGPHSSAASAGGGTLASVFNGTQPNGTWRLYIIDDATASAGNFNGGWSLDITAGGSFGAKRFTSSDFTGDGQTDVSIYRPSNGNWWIRNSATYGNSVMQWGVAGDTPVPSDYDGDGKTDLAIFRPSSGTWIILNSATSTASFTGWGNATDNLVPADFDGDGKVDLVIWRDSTQQFWVRLSTTGAVRVVTWGASGDIPVRGHFEGTDGADFAVFRPSNGTWYILSNNGGTTRQQQWGISTDELVQADYDADGKTDIAVWRPSDGNWYIFNSGSGTATISHVGSSGDTPVPGDYDGDSKSDLAVWRGAEGGWYIYNSGTTVLGSALRQDAWGVPTDIAVPSTYYLP